MQTGSSISVSSLGDGLAGNISASTNTLNMSDSSITSQAEGNGDGGDIAITAASSIAMQNNSTISSSALGAGLAGDISVDAGQQLNMSNSSISTEATVSDGGNIDVQAVKLIYLDQAKITTSVESGVGGGGNIDIDPDFVILKQSSILANAFGGPGGNINIIAGNFITTPDSVVDASSALGIDGTVNISSPDEEINKELAVLPDNVLDVTSLISARCGSPAGASSLVDAGPGGITIDPDGYLPSYATATDLDYEQEKGESNSVSNNRWWAPYSHQSALQIAELTCLR
jgi:large exoprotein involved in heme utilization and adhesion